MDNCSLEKCLFLIDSEIGLANLQVSHKPEAQLGLLMSTPSILDSKESKAGFEEREILHFLKQNMQILLRKFS